MNNAIPFIEPWRRDLHNVLHISPESAFKTKYHTRKEYEILKSIRSTVGKVAYSMVMDDIAELLIECIGNGFSEGYKRGHSEGRLEARAFAGAIIALEEVEQKENTHSRPENPVSVAQ